MARTERPGQPSGPDPARSYERARPEEEAGMGRLDNNKATPARGGDPIKDAVSNRHASRQLNSQDVVNEREEPKPVPPKIQHRGESKSQ